MEITINVNNIVWDSEHIEVLCEENDMNCDNLPKQIDIEYDYDFWKSIESYADSIIETDLFNRYNVFVSSFDWEEDLDGFRNKKIDLIIG